MKKSFILLFVFLFSLLAVMGVAAEGADINAMGTTGTPGSLAEVKIVATSEGGISGLSLEVIYDDTKLLLYDVKDSEMENSNHGKAEDGNYTLSWTDGGNKTEVVLTFLIKSETEAGSYAVTVKEGDNEKSVNVKVTEEGALDVDSDGEVTELDATYIAKYVVSCTDYADMADLKGDVNGDGVVNLLDAICLARSVDGQSGYVYDMEREKPESIEVIENDFAI